MAKKLGILALVVCMLLCVAVVASADNDCSEGPYKENGSFKPHFSAELLDGETEVCKACGALWSESHKNAEGKCPNKTSDNAEKYTLANFRKNATDKVAKVDAEYELESFTGTASGTKVESLTDAQDGKKGWKVYQDEIHEAGQPASGTVYRRTCVYCKQYEYCAAEVEHTWAFVQPADDDRKECTSESSVQDAGELYCTVCGQKNTKSETAPARGHDWQYKEILQSCTTGGGKGDVCARCGMLSNDETLKGEFKYDGDHKFVANANGGLGHDWVLLGSKAAAGKLQYASSGMNAKGDGSNIEIEPDSTPVGCEDSLEVVYVCKRASCTKDIDSTEAAKLTTVTVGKTSLSGNLGHADDGRVTLTITSMTTANPDKGHVWDKETYKPATCELKGRDTRTCLVCGLEQITKVYENANATGHKGDGFYRHDATTHGLNSVHYQLCAVCGKKCEEKKCQEDTVAEPTDSWVNPVPIEANCTTGASTIFECKKCKYKENVATDGSTKLDANKVTDYTKHYGYQANPHTSGAEDTGLKEENLAKWTTKTVTAAAACNKPGTAQYTCKYCGKVALTKAIPGEHDMVMQSSTLKDCTKQWVEVWVCSREDCPGEGVEPAKSGKDEKGSWTATITTNDEGKIVQRRIYKANEKHDFYNCEYDVVKEPTCVKPGERYPICNICGVKGDKEEPAATGVHDYTVKDPNNPVPADCIHPARVGEICKMCGEPKPGTTPQDVPGLPALGHNYANPTYYKNKGDADAAKPGTELSGKPTSCTEGYAVRTDCTRCDAYKVEEHAGGSHTWSKEAVHKAPTCTLNDRTVFVCTVCGVEDDDDENDYAGAGVVDNYKNAGGYGIADESLRATGHTWGAWTAVDDASKTEAAHEHKRVCSVCGASEQKPCSSVGEKFTKPNKDLSHKASCNEVQIDVYVCPECNYSYTVYGTALDPNNHDFEDVPVEGREPTCTEKGLVIEKCPYCEATGLTKQVDALGHAWERKTGNWTTGLVITQEPTCVADGVAHRVCEFCGLTTEDFTVGKYDGANTQFGHTWTRADYVWSADQLIVDVEPTCTVDGTGHYVCADCGYELTTGIPHYDGASTPWGHTWNRPDYVWSIDQLTISTEPTCVADGEGYYECSDCGYKLVVPVPHYDGANTPYGHVWAHEAWPAGLVVNEDGTYYYQCSDCGYLFQEQ